MGKVAFVFPGQGAQAVGMGRDIYDASSAARQVFAMAGDAITALTFTGPAPVLNQTVHTQPCLFTVELACAAALQEKGIEAAGTAGFSLGELAAVAFSGMLQVEDAFALTRLRAQAMQACAEKHVGGMFAVLRLSTAQVEGICAALGNAFPVNYNCAGQTVVACLEESYAPLQEAVKSQGGRALRLAVNGPFHSPYMDQASKAVADHLTSMNYGFSQPRIPVYANQTAEVYQDPLHTLSQQVNHPVLWHKTIENMVADGFSTFIEVGPGQVLSGLIAKISPEVRTLHAGNLPALERTVDALQGT